MIWKKIQKCLKNDGTSIELSNTSRPRNNINEDIVRANGSSSINVSGGVSTRDTNTTSTATISQAPSIHQTTALTETSSQSAISPERFSSSASTMQNNLSSSSSSGSSNVNLFDHQAYNPSEGSTLL